MERDFDRWGVMAIYLPASGLVAGRYEAVLWREANPPERVIALPFEVVLEE